MPSYLVWLVLDELTKGLYPNSNWVTHSKCFLDFHALAFQSLALPQNSRYNMYASAQLIQGAHAGLTIWAKVMQALTQQGCPFAHTQNKGADLRVKQLHSHQNFAGGVCGTCFQRPSRDAWCFWPHTVWKRLTSWVTGGWLCASFPDSLRAPFFKYRRIPLWLPLCYWRTKSYFLWHYFLSFSSVIDTNTCSVLTHTSLSSVCVHEWLHWRQWLETKGRKLHLLHLKTPWRCVNS
jgi:hypothetical protein